MAKAVVCVGNRCTGIPIHVCVRGSEDVFVRGRSVCRKGDMLTVGETLTQERICKWYWHNKNK